MDVSTGRTAMKLAGYPSLGHTRIVHGEDKLSFYGQIKSCAHGQNVESV